MGQVGCACNLPDPLRQVRRREGLKPLPPGGPPRPLGSQGLRIVAHVHSFSSLPVGLLRVRARLRMLCFPPAWPCPGRQGSTISPGRAPPYLRPGPLKIWWGRAGKGETRWHWRVHVAPNEIRLAPGCPPRPWWPSPFPVARGLRFMVSNGMFCNPIPANPRYFWPCHRDSA